MKLPTDGYFDNVLQVVATNANEVVVRVLLDRGTREGLFGNTLQAAAYGGYEGVAQLLLDCGG